MILYLIRHGETAWNREEIFRGRADVPLTSKGEREARAVAGALRARPISEIFSSPLSRAMETARPLASALGIPIRPEPALIDVDFGRWQGVAKEEVRNKQVRLYRLWEHHPEKVHFPGGESLSRVRSRAVRFVRGVIRSRPDRDIALVSHRVVLKVTILSLLNLPNSRFWEVLLDPASISAFEISPPGRPKVKQLNDVCHLAAVAGSRAVRDF